VISKELMTESPATVTADETAQRAAQIMADNDCGCLPVVESNTSRRVIGVVTDRDLALRALAKGRGPDTRVRDVMTEDPLCCTADTDLKDLQQMMADRQVRRIVIVDSNDGCVGIVAQADLARASERGREVTDREVAHVVQKISEPDASSRGRSRGGSAGDRSLEQPL
jgi:CBS domain-containing protein